MRFDKFTLGKLIMGLTFHLGHERWDTELKLRWKYGHWRMPRRVYIETFEFCPHRCSYCTNGHDATRMPMRRMSEETFELALRRLQEMDWTGVVGFQRINEPLLEARLPRFVARARQVLPKAYLRTNTAGQYLTRELLQELIAAGINKLVITQHEWVDAEWKERIAALCREFGRYIDYRGPIGSAPWKINFGGRVPVPNGRPWKACRTILDNIFICWDGTVPMCFADTDRKLAVGNIKDKPLLDIILAPEYAAFRKRVAGTWPFFKGTPELEICKACFKGT